MLMFMGTSDLGVGTQPVLDGTVAWKDQAYSLGVSLAPVLLFDDHVQVHWLVMYSSSLRLCVNIFAELQHFIAYLETK